MTSERKPKCRRFESMKALLFEVMTDESDGNEPTFLYWEMRSSLCRRRSVAWEANAERIGCRGYCKFLHFQHTSFLRCWATRTTRLRDFLCINAKISFNGEPIEESTIRPQHAKYTTLACILCGKDKLVKCVAGRSVKEAWTVTGCPTHIFRSSPSAKISNHSIMRCNWVWTLTSDRWLVRPIFIIRVYKWISMHWRYWP